MRKLILLASWVISSNVFAAHCPDFAGRFKGFEGQIYTVKQTDCANILLSYQEGVGYPTSSFSFMLDGKRHTDGSVYWFAFWDGDKFVRESWSSAEGGTMIGFREFWTLQPDGMGKSIYVQQIDPDDGSVISRKVLKQDP